MSERLSSPEQPGMTVQQETALRGICDRYEVGYDPSHYFVYPDDSAMMAGWAEGWVGGAEIQREHPTIYCGVSPEGQIHT